MRRLMLLFLFAGCLCMTTAASPVDRAKALEMAQKLFAEQGMTGGTLTLSAANVPSSTGMHAPNGRVPYFVVNRSAGGFAIVAGDDAAEGILGYSSQGALNVEAMPEALADWLTGLAEQVDAAASAGRQQAAPQGAAQSDPTAYIEPMLATDWNQGAPYNSQCPTINGNTPWAGCVATAMSQVMYYWQWPQEATGEIPAYTVNSRAYDALPATTFDWDAMTDHYNESSTEEAIAAMANLIHYTGRSVSMSYGMNGSSAYMFDVPNALSLRFGYDSHVQSIYRNSYGVEEWNEIIYHEMEQGRPVIYSGKSYGNVVHAFILDGYDGNGYFHVNWGYGGAGNGWFRLQALNLQNLRTDGGNDLSGFSFNQSAIVGIQPPNDEATSVVDHFASFLACDSAAILNTDPLDYDPVAGLSGLSLSYKVTNKASKRTRFIVGAAIYQDGTPLEYKQITNFYLSPTSYTQRSFTLNSFAKGLDDGEYRIALVSRVYGTNGWIACYGADSHYIDMTIADGVCTLTNVSLPPAIPYLDPVECSTSLAFVGEKTKVSVVYENEDEFDFNGFLNLIINNEVVTGEAGYLAPGNSDLVEFYFRPTTAGETVAIISTDNYGANVVASIPFVVNERSLNATAVMAEEHPTFTLPLQAEANVVNEGTADYYGGIMVLLRQGEEVVDTLLQETVFLMSGENETVDVSYNGDGLTVGDVYNIAVAYPDGRIISVSPGCRLVEAMLYWTANGTSQLIPVGELPSDAIAVDITAVNSTGDALIPNENPNTIYYLSPRQQVPALLQSLNCVVGDRAEHIQLVQGYDCRIPVPFDADEVTFRYMPIRGTDGHGGWDTVVLPFEVEEVMVEEDNRTIDWFRSVDDEMKDFWLKEYAYSVDGQVAFCHAANWLANVPYIIAVPSDTWGIPYDLRNKTLLFSAYNTHLDTTELPSVEWGDFEFKGSYAATELEDEFLLDADGKEFVRNTGELPSFSCWFHAVNDGTGHNVLRICRYDETDGIQPMIESQESRTITVYTIDGRKVADVPSINGLPDMINLPRGIYVAKGRKYVK